VNEVVDASAVGCVMVNVLDVVHPFASVTVTTYVPAPRPLAVGPDPPEGDHA